MDTEDRAPGARPDVGPQVVLVSGLVLAFVGLALHTLADARIEQFLSSAMVFTGAMMVIPQLVVRALLAQRKP